MNYFLFRKLSKSSSTLLTLIAAIALMGFTSCASTDTWFKQASSPLPIEVRHSGSGQIMTFRAHETSDRLYVVGSAKKHQLSNGAHIDIQLVTSDGTIVAEKQDDINPVSLRPDGGKRYSDSYVASFPLETARGAKKIRIVYRGGTHSTCLATSQG
jgi:hypothetical protein